MNNILKNHELAQNSVRRLRQTLEIIQRVTPELPEPLETRADSVIWTGQNGTYAQITAWPEHVGFMVFANYTTPVFVRSAATNEEITDCVQAFAAGLAQYGLNNATDLQQQIKGSTDLQQQNKGSR